MKVQENFKPMSQAIPILSKRNCWKVCDTCQKPWNQIQTSGIHMIVRAINNQSKTRFICDGCLEKLKSEGNVEIQRP